MPTEGTLSGKTMMMPYCFIALYLRVSGLWDTNTYAFVQTTTGNHATTKTSRLDRPQSTIRIEQFNKLTAFTVATFPKELVLHRRPLVVDGTLYEPERARKCHMSKRSDSHYRYQTPVVYKSQYMTMLPFYHLTMCINC